MKKFIGALVFLFLLCLVFSPEANAQGTTSNVSVTSVANGKVLLSSISKGATVVIDSTNTTGAVWFVRTNNPCPTYLSGPAGTRLSRDSSKDPAGWLFDPLAEHYTGQVCVILDTGSGPVTLRVNEW